MEQPARYLQASSTQPGALGIIHAYADDAVLAERLDRRLARKRNGALFESALAKGELRYGWLAGAGGESIDEVMLAKPAPGFRVLMTHGGAMVRRAVTGFLHDSAFAKMDVDSLRDEVVDPLLSSAVTQTQAAAILEARENARAGLPADIPPRLLLTHRILLAGPPNAGKSSLFNRLAGYDRAFVHEEAGATLDVVDELIDLGGFAVLLGDLPGFRPDAGGLEQAAWSKAAERLGLAEAVLFVVDGSRPWDSAADRAAEAIAPFAGRPILVVLNKADLPLAVEGTPWARHFPQARAIRVCSLPEGDAAEKAAAEAPFLL